MEFIKILFRVLSLGQSEKKLTLLFLSGALGVACAQTLEPLLFGRVIDALAKDAQFAHFVKLWIGLGTINASLSVFLSIATDRYAHRQRLRAMNLAFERTISLPYHYHSINGSGKVVRTIQSGCDQVFHITLSFFRENLIAFGSVALLVPMAFSVETKLATALFVLALVYVLCNWYVIRRTHVRQAQVELKHQDLTARLIDAMGNVGVIRSFTRVGEEVKLFRGMVEKVLQAQYPVLSWWGVLNVITRLSSMITMVTIVAIGSFLVQRGEASQGQIVTFVGFSTLLIARLEQLSSFINRVVGQMPTAKNLFDLIDHVDEEDQRGGTFTTAKRQGHLRFEHVTFQYKLRGEKAQGVFDLNFEVQAGQSVALVGPTGSGKSTCLSLLQRLYPVDEGRILIDGQDIAELSVASLCGSIATVFQEPGLFNRSIYDNILVGCPSASFQEVVEAARQADAHDFIMARPGGYDFIVGERGLALSGGERQRIAIARAILKDAPILVLDEATSALDNATEKKIQAAMQRLQQGRTTLTIAHRLSTVYTADLILVLAEGRVQQAGTFQELRQADGLFARLLAAGELEEHSLDFQEHKTDRAFPPLRAENLAAS